MFDITTIQHMASSYRLASRKNISIDYIFDSGTGMEGGFNEPRRKGSNFKKTAKGHPFKNKKR